jgi:hypothetical protein
MLLINSFILLYDDNIYKMSDLINFYELPAVKELAPKSHNPNYSKHGLKVPFRAIVIGGSGSMKTNTTMNILHQMNGTFNKVYVFTRNKDEPLYEHLELAIPDKDELEIHEGLDFLKTINMDKHFFGQTLVIFDDLVNEKNQDIIGELFLRGRKLGKDKAMGKNGLSGISMIYMTQKYAMVPTLIREQCNYIILKKISSKRDTTYILRNHSLSLEIEELMKIYQYCVGNDPLNFLLIDLNVPADKAYRLNFNKILDLDYFKSK